MNLVELLFETADIFEKCQEKIPCEFSDFLSENRFKLFELSFYVTMAHVDVNFAKENFIRSEIYFRNYFYQKILEEFEFVKKNCFF